MRAKSEHSGPPNTRFVEIRRVRQTGSTNQDLLVEAERGAKEGLVLVADHQSAGRGRQGRAWLDGGVNRDSQSLENDEIAERDANDEAESGDEVAESSLLVSWLLRPGIHMQSSTTIIPLLTGLAVADALQQLCGIRVGVKWPNDLLSVPTSGRVADERKLAGILVQGSTMGDDTTIVVGLGLNLGPPASLQMEGTATDLQTELSGQRPLKAPPTRFEVLHRVLVSVEKLYRRLEEGDSEFILRRYRQRCVTLGRQVEMHTTGGVVSGRADDIDCTGGLIIETDSGPAVMTAGDAHHIGKRSGEP